MDKVAVIIMVVTIPFLVSSQEQLNEMIKDYTAAETENGIQYLIKYEEK